MSASRSRNGRSRRSRQPRYDPNFWVSEVLPITVADTPDNRTLYTNPDATPVSFRMQRSMISVNAGAASSCCLFVVRRVPQGFTAPTTITISTGTAPFVDAPDVIGYQVIYITTGTNTLFQFPFIPLHPTITLYEGDSVVLQAVTNSASAGQGYTSLIEYGTRYL